MHLFDKILDININFVFLLQVVIVFKAVQYSPITFGEYEYPGWAVALWWMVCACPIIAMPAMMVYKTWGSGMVR